MVGVLGLLPCSSQPANQFNGLTVAHRDSRSDGYNIFFPLVMQSRLDGLDVFFTQSMQGTETLQSCADGKNFFFAAVIQQGFFAGFLDIAT